MAAPLLDYTGDLVGVIQVINQHEGDFTGSDKFVMEVLAAQAGVAIQRSHLIERQVENVKTQKELRIAGDIQKQCLPAGSIGIPNYEVETIFQPAEQVGGDCYDFLKLDDGTWLVLLGDATGHGLASSLISVETRALVRGISSRLFDLVRSATRVNELLTIDLPSGKFITAFMGFLDPVGHCLYFIIAGQEPILFFNHGAGTIQALSSTGLPFGIMPGADYSQMRSVRFDIGDTLWVTTDGFPEYRNREGAFFEKERLMACLQKHAAMPLDIGSRQLMDEIQRFAGDVPQQDDLTMISLRRVS